MVPTKQSRSKVNRRHLKEKRPLLMFVIENGELFDLKTPLLPQLFRIRVFAFNADVPLTIQSDASRR